MKSANFISGQTASKAAGESGGKALKIVSVVGSGRINGNTDRLVRVLEQRLRNLSAERGIPLSISHILLGTCELRQCRGCRICFEKGGSYCPIHDDLQNLVSQITDADGLIFASPVYMEDVSGLMKCLLDRMAYLSHRPSLYRKRAVLLTTSGAGASGRSLKTMKNALSAWGAQAVAMKNIRAGARIDGDGLLKVFLAQADQISRALLDSLAPEMLQKPSFYALLAFGIQRRYYLRCTRAAQIDRDYWRSHGWLDRNVSYFMPVKCGFLKQNAAKAFGLLISFFFI